MFFSIWLSNVDRASRFQLFFTGAEVWDEKINLNKLQVSNKCKTTIMKTSKLLFFASADLIVATSINRERVIGQFNPVRYASSNSTPMQVGNGNFAFGADVTGLQTFQPFAIMSSWGWHNFSLPTAPGQSSISDFTGLDWYVSVPTDCSRERMLMKIGGLMDG